MKPPSPKDFMKKRRPKRFSDSKIITESKLNRTILEYQLDTLGNRKQERDFEEFARKLCQYEICPNLRPQTGSTGGGDSKVDSATIPVTSQIQILFFQGQDNQDKKEFAFAFSTQKNWSGKVKSDVEEIYKTGRSYAKVFCVTSEFARDKTRASLEDELSRKYGFQVIILDRSWILDKVFGNRRQKLAIEELKLGDGLEEKIEIGPLDYQRRKQFDELNTSITEDVNKNRLTIKTVDNCLDVALIAAELEQTRQDVDGLFDRAIRFAKEYGTDDQYFTAIYQKTWTTFFWFEDFPTFLKLYDEVEKLALVSNNIFNTERLNNLWGLLSALSSTSNLVSKVLLDEKTKHIREKLNSHIKNDANSSASVQAEAMLCFANLLQSKNDPVEVTKVFQQLKTIMDKADNLIGFPFEITFQILNEMDDEFSGNSAYEELQEHLVEIVTKREGDLSAGNLLLNRGMQHLKAGRMYKSIDFLGRALRRFYKKESKDRLVHALFFLSIAYEDAGLLWAARGALLNAASHATSDFWIYSEINTMQLACYKRLKTIELRLGRVGYALEWHRLHLILASQLTKTDDEKNKLLEESIYFGSVMGILLIQTPDEDLKKLELLPDTLMRMDLDFAAFGLIYRLGGRELLPEFFLDNMTPEEIENFFNSWLSQPANDSLPDKPEFYEDNSIQLKSKILGCDYIVQSPNKSPEIEVGEYILGALESFLSTGMIIHSASRDSRVNITLISDTTLSSEIKYEVQKDGQLGFSVRCGAFNPHHLTREQQEKLCSNISEVVLQIVANTVMFKNPDTDLLTLFKDEEVSSRAFSFSSPLVTLGNVLGYEPKRSISKWIEKGSKTYVYSPENSRKPVTKNETGKTNEKIHGGVIDDSTIRHDEIKNISVIRLHLWDKAGWSGVFYATLPSNPPILAFLFKDEDAAKAIFKDWRETFGAEDKNETIRVSMIRGVSQDNPTWYRAVVTTNLDTTKPSKNRFITVSRIHTLTPTTTENLDRFTESFKHFGMYLLAPAIMDKTKSYPNVLTEFGIVKTCFIDKQAWEIGPNDLDIAGITDDTKPIIPKNIKDAPVLELLKKRSTQSK